MLSGLYAFSVRLICGTILDPGPYSTPSLAPAVNTRVSFLRSVAALDPPIDDDAFSYMSHSVGNFITHGCAKAAVGQHDTVRVVSHFDICKVDPSSSAQGNASVEVSITSVTLYRER